MRLLSILTLVLAGGLIALWDVQGTHLATLTEAPARTTSVDAFGDEVEAISWEDTFEIGLDVAVPDAGGLGLLALGFFLSATTSRKKRVLATLVLGCLGIIGAVVSIVIAYVG